MREDPARGSEKAAESPKHAVEDEVQPEDRMSTDMMGAPLDAPLGVDEYGATAAEQVQGEPLDDRLSREEPDVFERPLTGDDTSETGSLVQADSDADRDDVAEAVAVEVDPNAVELPAEEAAMHIEPEGPAG